METETLLPLLAVLLFLSSTWFVLHYAKRSTSFFIILLSIISFALGSAAVALLPIDLSYASLAASASNHSNADADNNFGASDGVTNDDGYGEGDGADNNTDENEINDSNNINPTYLPWKLTYWVTFLFAWLVLPLTRESLLSGHFTLCRRLQDGISKSIHDILLMIFCGVVAIIGMAIHLLGSSSSQYLSPCLVISSNIILKKDKSFNKIK